jgi:hypothetical protein
MSAKDDLQNIAVRFGNETPKTAQAKVLRNNFIAWFKQLDWFDKNMYISGTAANAKRRWLDYIVANAVADVDYAAMNQAPSPVPLTNSEARKDLIKKGYSPSAPYSSEEKALIVQYQPDWARNVTFHKMSNGQWSITANSKKVVTKPAAKIHGDSRFGTSNPFGWG